MLKWRKMARALDGLRNRRIKAFRWHNTTQFLGALNDNVFKMLIQMYLIGIAPDAKSRTLAFATILFALPFLILAPYGGYLADRFSKKAVSVILKYAELVIMLLGVIAFAFSLKIFLFVLLFLMSAQSALFSPTKYGIVPEIVPRERIPLANSNMVIASFMAIIVGSALAPTLAEATHYLWKLPGAPVASSAAQEGLRYAVAQAGCVILALTGVIASLRVWPLRPANPTREVEPFFLRQIGLTAKKVSTDRPLTLAILACGMFSFIAAFLQINLIRYGMDHMGYDERISSYLFFFAATGIAAGAFIAGRLSTKNIEFGTAPLGTGLMTLAALVLGIQPLNPSPWFVKLWIFLAGCGAGLFTVPLDAFLLYRIPGKSRGEVLALNSFISWAGILLSGGLLYALGAAGIAAHHSFLLIALVGLFLSLGCLFILRDFFLRFIVRGLVAILYRVKTSGMDNLPQEGPALLIANHASYMDALLLATTTRRRIRFLMSRRIYEEWRFLLPFFKLYGVIPVSADESPRKIIASLQSARQALADGYLVCVFPEGGITRTGTVQAFRRGFERIAKGTDYPIIPVYLGGSWGSLYHYYRGQLIGWRKSLFRLPYRVHILFGTPLPPTSTVFTVRQAVMELSVDYFNARKELHRSIGEHFVKQARRFWFETVADDSISDKKWTWGQTLIAAIAMRNRLAPRLGDDRHVGILLPPSCGAMIANVAVTLDNRVAVNLNFTSSQTAFRSALQQCSLRVVLTSRAFLQRLPELPLAPDSIVYVEDLAAGIKLKDKVSALLQGLLIPAAALTHAAKAEPDNTAFVLFSSGSTGDPKGVMLSHHNVLSMLESLRMVLAISSKDRLCSALPLFHSFGLMATVWLPLLNHVPVSYHTNPLDADSIVRIVRQRTCTLLLTTPTFLALYHRKADPDDFRSLRFILAGAEKLSDNLAQAFEDKFGVRPLEAYGATEFAPGIAVSVPHGVGGGIVHEGWKQGRVGHPLPGIATKILDPETGEPLPPGQPGLLYLKGPNLMLGYLGRPDLTDEVMHDGWYCTGDIALVDEDGFIGITDRLSRFSKVAGEMVPHVAIEGALQKQLSLTGPVLAVTGVPDERKGERPVVLHTAEAGTSEALFQACQASELPNLWRPARSDFHLVDEIPLLGTGKMDLAGIRSLAREIADSKSQQ